MKVLSGHVMTKSQAGESMDLLIMPASVHLNMGLPVLQQAGDSKFVNTSHTENINQKRWKNIFQRVLKKKMDSACTCQCQNKALFGQALSGICEKDGSPPKPIMEILSVLLRDGPYTEGVFRRAGNARCLKEIREQLNNGLEVDLKEKPVILLADLLKEFLRHIPGSLLVVDQYQTWMTAMKKQDVHEMCTELQLVIEKLPEPNIQLLKHLICILYHISANAEQNKMDSNNLAVCVSPNLLQVDRVEDVKNISNLTQFIIDNCCEIFGEDILLLFEDPDDEELSDTHDSISSLHTDSAYDSNDPDVDGYKGSYTDMHTFHSDSEEKTPDLFQISSSLKLAASQTSKPFIRRCSEPTIVVNKGARNLPVLSRSQTETDFYGQQLTKQTSDECSCCSTSSLESTLSSTSESIQTSSPIISPSRQRQSLQRKQSLPHRQIQHGNAFGEVTKKRSQSMKNPNSRIAFSRGGASKRAQKVLRQSQTLPDVLPFNKTFLKQQKPQRVSSVEVFQVDSRILSDPPSYRQAIQVVPHTTFALSSSMTVEAARCLSKDTCSQTTFLSAEPSNFCLVRNCSDVHSCRGGEKSHDLNVSATSPESGLGCLSETMYKASNSSIAHCYSQQLLESLNVKESYV
ncbi:T cell activation RhoGTPase activating protein a [Trichomycterus rosablanca]|uniref:T cell activation RhoGTPase activating protein a n=1 Tax=Trichomycterus rosablanca TaxID=2290929 RepID=UPI002F35E3F0